MCKNANVKVFSNLKAMAHTISWQLRNQYFSGNKEKAEASKGFQQKKVY